MGVRILLLFLWRIQRLWVCQMGFFHLEDRDLVRGSNRWVLRRDCRTVRYRFEQYGRCRHLLCMLNGNAENWEREQQADEERREKLHFEGMICIPRNNCTNWPDRGIMTRNIPSLNKSWLQQNKPLKRLWDSHETGAPPGVVELERGWDRINNP